MSVPAFIETPARQVLATGRIVQAYCEGNAVRFVLTDGSMVIDTYATAAAAQAAYTAYLTVLEVASGSGAPTFAGMTPNSVPMNLWTISPVNFAITGTNFPPGASVSIGALPYLTFNDILQTSTLIAGSWGAGDAYVGVWDIVINGPSGVLLTIPNGFTVTGAIGGGDSMNPTIRDLTKAAPAGGLTPADPTKDGFWTGSSDGVNYDTFYEWDPDTASWIALISV